MLHLYYHLRSTFSRRVRVVLLQKQIEHEATVVNLATGEHRKPAFLA
jgi:glutathione S-transferase